MMGGRRNEKGKGIPDRLAEEILWFRKEVHLHRHAAIAGLEDGRLIKTWAERRVEALREGATPLAAVLDELPARSSASESPVINA